MTCYKLRIYQQIIHSQCSGGDGGLVLLTWLWTESTLIAITSMSMHLYRVKWSFRDKHNEDTWTERVTQTDQIELR